MGDSSASSLKHDLVFYKICGAFGLAVLVWGSVIVCYQCMILFQYGYWPPISLGDYIQLNPSILWDDAPIAAQLRDAFLGTPAGLASVTAGVVVLAWAGKSLSNTRQELARVRRG